MELDVTRALRCTVQDVRDATETARQQLVRSLRDGADVGGTLEGAIATLLDFVDLEPGTDVTRLTAHQRNHKRNGLVFLQLREREEQRRVFEGWFWDRLRHPSTRTHLRDGRLFLAGTTTPAGVLLRRGRFELEQDARVGASALVEALVGIGTRLAVTVPLRRVLRGARQ